MDGKIEGHLYQRRDQRQSSILDAVILCGSSLRPPSDRGVDPLVRLASESGFAGIGIGRGCFLPTASALLSSALRAGLGPGALAAPLGEQPLPLGKRHPRLGAEMPDERAAAIALTVRSLELAGGVGMAAVALDFGPVALHSPMAPVARRFATRELEEDDLEEGPLGAALRERRRLGNALLDACRWSLEALLPHAERRGVTLAMELGPTPWGVPSPREAMELIALFGGAAVGVAFDPAKLMVMRALGLPLSDERVAALRKVATVVVENDAVGVDVGYLPGLGERDDDLAGGGDGFAKKIPVIVVGPADATDEEAAAAAALARRRYE
jgi:sugar phosphate isomerase/epimerase